jgi:hypothetical protein
MNNNLLINYKKQNKSNIAKFVNHEKHNKIYFDEHRKCFKLITNAKLNQEIKLPGLKPLLQQIFFPDYEYTRKKGDASSGVSNPFEGIERGEIVHEQLMDYFNLTKNEFIKKQPKLHFYTSKTIKALKEWNLKPMFSEICIWNNNVATRMDGGCTDELNQFILLEWKTGMDGYFLRGNSDMKGILQGMISNSPLNQALLQLLISKVMIENEYNVSVHKEYVVHIHKDGIIPYEIPKKILEMKIQIYDYFITNVIAIKALKTKIYSSLNKKKKMSIKKKKSIAKKFAF